MRTTGLPEWLLKLLSVDTDRLQGGTEHLRFARFPEGSLGLLALLALAAGCAFFVWNYRFEGHLPRWKKLGLAAFRCGLLLAAGAVAFYPVLEVDRARELRAATLVLVDESLSFSLRDRYQSEVERRNAIARALGIGPDEVPAATRSELVERALGSPTLGILDRLAKENHLKVHAFSGLPLRPIEPEATAAALAPKEPGVAAPEEPGAERPGGLRLPRIDPRGVVTDIAGALRAAVEAEGEAKIAGIVLFTDGRVTAGEDLKAVAASLREKGIPVHAVGVGDPTPPRNFRVTAVLANERVFAGDPIVVDVRADQRGYDGETARVELLDVFEPAGEAPRAPVKVEAQDVAFEAGRSEVTASFRFEPKGVGRHRLSARIEPRNEEAFSDDNERIAVVEVVQEASKVLLISGGPSYEYRFLKNLLRRDARVFLAGWLMSADPDYPQEGDTSLKKLPDSPKELFEYDVVLLMDIDPQGLPQGFPALLEEFVGKRRGGLGFLAGETFGAGLFDAPEAAPLRAMLPVACDPSEVKDEMGRGKFYDREWPLDPTPAALAHPATRLSSQIDKNRQLWAEIAGIYWSFPARKAKPGATVLFVHPDPALEREREPRPIVAAQFYAGGRVLWCGINSTWRWRATSEEVYDRFWVQSIRYLTESRLLGDRRRLIQTDRESYDLGDTLRISAYLSDESFRPVDAEEESVTVEDPGGAATEVRLAKDPSSPGWFRGIFIPRRLGEHKFRLAGAGGAQVERAVRVEVPAVEFDEPRLDEAVLKELGALTEGSYTPLAGVATVPERIPDRRQTVITTDEPIPLWDNTFAMSVLAGLLTIEWILRKWSRLL